MILKCPKCGNTQKYEPRTKTNLNKKRKTCVYCGHTFKIIIKGELRKAKKL